MRRISHRPSGRTRVAAKSTLLSRLWRNARAFRYGPPHLSSESANESGRRRTIRANSTRIRCSRWRGLAYRLSCASPPDVSQSTSTRLATATRVPATRRSGSLNQAGCNGGVVTGSDPRQDTDALRARAVSHAVLQRAAKATGAATLGPCARRVPRSGLACATAPRALVAPRRQTRRRVRTAQGFRASRRRVGALQRRRLCRGRTGLPSRGCRTVRLRCAGAFWPGFGPTTGSLAIPSLAVQ